MKTFTSNEITNDIIVLSTQGYSSDYIAGELGVTKNEVQGVKALLFKQQGYSDSSIASFLGIPQGYVQSLTKSIAVHVQRHCRKDQRQGHFRPNPFGEPSTAQPAVKKLAKSSVPADEPPVIGEAREMLALGITPDAVCKQLGITRELMHKHLHEHWNV